MKLIIAGCVLMASTFVLLKVNQMKTTAVCRDVRLYMDGGYSAIIQSGGLSSKTTLTVFKKEGRKQLNLGTINVKPTLTKDKGIALTSYKGPNINMTLSNSVKPHVQGKPATIEGIIGNDKFNAQLGCQGPQT